MGVHVGEPAGSRRSMEVPWPVRREYDEGLRFDLLAALVERWADDAGPDVDATHLWLSRVGMPEPHDQDLLWLASADRALRAHGLEPVALRVVTKNGWLDLHSGERRVWRRLRLDRSH
jgi:hypothetical protein